jgi:hypothetical protein
MGDSVAGWLRGVFGQCEQRCSADNADTLLIICRECGELKGKSETQVTQLHQRQARRVQITSSRSRARHCAQPINHLAVDGDNEVTGADSRALGGTAALQLNDLNHRLSALEQVSQLRRSQPRPSDEPDGPAIHDTVPDNLAKHPLGSACCDAKRDVLRAHDDGRVDSNDLASQTRNVSV